MERWPPIYDASDLEAIIRDLSERGQLDLQFFSSIPADRVCQGDVVRLPSSIPLIHEDGQPAITGDCIYWMVIGNTCDIDRDIDTVSWSQIVPLNVFQANDLADEDLAALRRYRYSRRFYIPPWAAHVNEQHFVADFLRPVTIHKNALLHVAQVETKLSYVAWILLHSCLVRFLARDDGRFD